MCPRGVTAHGCSFTPVATQEYILERESLESLMRIVLNICHRRTHPAGCRSCAKTVYKTYGALAETSLTCSKVYTPVRRGTGGGSCVRGAMLRRAKRPYGRQKARKLSNALFCKCVFL